MKAERFSLTFTRVEVQWLHRQIVSGRMQAEAQMAAIVGPLAVSKADELADLTIYKDELLRLEGVMFERLKVGDQDRLKIGNLMHDLEEALELNPDAKEIILERMANIPKEESYNITFDRETAKFVLKLVENDLTKYKLHTIPNYEKKSEKDFKDDPIQNKTYWVNKAHKAKNILDNLRTKFEREL
jgi:hypothetical protein